MRRLLVSVSATVLGVALLGGTPPATSRVAAGPFPESFALPDGFQPEGIALGPGPTAWFGSRVDGDIYEVSLRTGAGTVISQGPGTPSVGMKSDRQGRLYVAGGPSGTARVVDTGSGAVIASYALTAAPTFVNDVVLTKRAAWFTDSARAQLYRVGRDADGAPAPTATTLPLTGDWVQGTGFGANGISTTPTGRALLVVNSTTGLLYRVDPRTGEATGVDLGGASLTAGDGMLRHGRTLYVVRNQLNQVAVLRLSRDGLRGRLVRTITTTDVDPSCTPQTKTPPCFDVPTTVARFGSHLYLPNARFSTPPTATTPYWVTRVRAKPRR